MGTPQNALEESITYLNVYYLGVPFLILYNLGTGIFSALGDSKTPFIFLVVSSLGNIILDYIMVKPWGVAGVAWAIFIAQGIACINLILRVSFVFILTIPFGFTGVGWAWNLGWIIGTIIALSFYFNIPVLKKSYSISN